MPDSQLSQREKPPAYLLILFAQLEAELPALVASGKPFKFTINCDGKRLRPKLEERTYEDIALG
jgi:hypothetical protein